MTIAETLGFFQELAPLKLYFIGVGGSLAAELSAALREAGVIGGKCPPSYKQPFYLGGKIIFALGVAGPLPYMIDATNGLTAFYIGLTAPLIIERLSKGQLPGGKGPDTLLPPAGAPQQHDPAAPA